MAVGIVVGVIVIVALALAGVRRRRSRRVAKAGALLSFDNPGFDVDPESEA